MLFLISNTQSFSKDLILTESEQFNRAKEIISNKIFMNYLPFLEDLVKKNTNTPEIFYYSAKAHNPVQVIEFNLSETFTNYFRLYRGYDPGEHPELNFVIAISKIGKFYYVNGFDEIYLKELVNYEIPKNVIKKNLKEVVQFYLHYYLYDGYFRNEIITEKNNKYAKKLKILTPFLVEKKKGLLKAKTYSFCPASGRFVRHIITFKDYQIIEHKKIIIKKGKVFKIR